MHTCGGCGNWQATVRSLHPNGVNVVFADNSVHFIPNSVETSGVWGDANPGFWPVWDRLICSGDRHPVDLSKIGGL
jgi:prepilin-type processing-associated H-X9-DG protein